MWINRRLILIFNKPLLVVNIVFSIIALRFVATNGITMLLMSIIIKLVGYAILIGYQNYFTPQIYFYYRNTGITLRKLYGYTFGFDMVMYFTMLLIYYLFT